MYKIIVLLALVFPLNAFGQIETSPKIDSVSGDSIIPASFKGDLEKYIRENVIYPRGAQNKGIQGKVVATFMVDTNGIISNIHIVKSVHELLDNEFLRVIGIMPPWNPATKKGEPVKSEKSLPLIFRLPD
ncbi:MAG: energy transducer TonB [Sporocytophaga sp.]|uniref:energy transducer TonB n=1 Tax=Sporocytophaga sp. TaxID=2231183 RepID=UPI001B24A894|nr:energy transducer TonB [Sporocytophaga sp.]MBO9703854.1 energy transducer TonB [Sporocytophaga sp.]